MTTSYDGYIENVVILSGTAVTRWIFGLYEYSDADAIHIQAPATLDAFTFTIETSYDGSTAATLYDGTTNIAPPAAGKSRQYIEMLGAKYFRIKASGNVAADRTFLVTKQWTA